MLGLLTGGSLLEQLLQVGDQPNDVVGWPCPHHHAMPFISEAGLDTRIFKLEKVLIDAKCREVRRKELLLLLGVSFHTMGSVKGLNFCLEHTGSVYVVFQGEKTYS